MMPETMPLLLYCSLILLSSVAGGLLPGLLKLTHGRMELALSFICGFMLGVAVLHLLPHALMSQADGAGGSGHAALNQIMYWLLAGFLVMFLVGRFFHFHHHEAESDSSGGDTLGDHARPLSWTGATVGFSIHTLVGGIALAASVATELRHGHGAGLPGFATFLVIFLHKPFDAMAIATLLKTGGVSSRRRHAVNVLFGLMTAAGVLLFLIGGGGPDQAAVVSAALAFSAGTFLCIALSDLLPELQFHEHDRWKLSAALLLGLLLAGGMAAYESAGHEHEIGHQHSP